MINQDNSNEHDFVKMRLFKYDREVAILILLKNHPNTWLYVTYIS